MLYFVLAVLFTVALYLIMRAYPRFGINSFHAVVFNYYACVATGLLLTPDKSVFKSIAPTSTGTVLTLALGILFVAAFLLIGNTAQKVSVTASSLAANMSLVIPVIFGLFVFKNNNKDFTALNYFGLVLAVTALALGGIKRQSPESRRVSGWVLALPVLTFLASGTNNTLINYLSSQFYQPGQTTVFMIIACLGAVLCGTTLLLIRIFTKGEKLAWRSIAGGLILGVPNFLSLYFLLLALGSFGNSAAFVFPVYNILTMLASALAARLIYGERLNNLNKLGLCIAVAAIVFISYQELSL